MTHPSVNRDWRTIPPSEQATIIEEVRAKLPAVNWRQEGRTCGVAWDTLRYQVDEPFRQHKLALYRRSRQLRAGLIQPEANMHLTVGRPPLADVAARLAEIPPDTRSPAARLMGDPIPSDPRRART